MAENKLVVDARGDACPIPVVKTLKALGALGGAGTVETIVDNRIAVENLTRMGENKGCTVTTDQTADKEWHVSVVTDKAVERCSVVGLLEFVREGAEAGRGEARGPHAGVRSAAGAAEARDRVPGERP